MKNKILFITALVVLLFVSCKKYLETDSPSTFTKQYIFEREDDIFSAVKGIYALLTQDAMYGTRVSFYYNCNTDVDMIAIGSNAGGRYDIGTFRVSTTDNEINNPWNYLYQTIDRANQCIEGIKSSPLYSTNANVKHMYGEAVTLRAWMYYELVRNWGDVPFKTKPTAAGDTFYIPTTNRDTILSRVISDLIAVEPSMYWSWSSKLSQGVERVNREFVQGMIARISLFRGGYSLHTDMTMKRNENDWLSYYKTADKYCKLMIDSGLHKLNSNYSQIFINECKYIVPSKDDVLYEIAFLSTISSEVGYFNGIKIAAGGAGLSNGFGSASASMIFPPSYFYSFDSLDTRLPATCAVYNLDGNLKQQLNSVVGITTGKWSKTFMTTQLGPTSQKGTGINWPIMRYSDVLLMYAEAENEINQGPGSGEKSATWCLEEVRRRAFGVAPYGTAPASRIGTTPTNYTDFFKAIVNERAWEFGGECIRKFDLVRWNLYGQKIAQTKQTITQMGIDTKAGTGTYASKPASIYTRYKSDNVTIEFAGLYKNIAVPSGYTATKWLNSTNILNSDGTPASIVTDSWKGYTDATGDAPVRYILPIPQALIIASQGVLQNYYNY